VVQASPRTTPQASLSRARVRLVDVFRTVDQDGTGSLDGHQLHALVSRQAPSGAACGLPECAASEWPAAEVAQRASSGAIYGAACGLTATA